MGDELSVVHSRYIRPRRTCRLLGGIAPDRALLRIVRKRVVTIYVRIVVILAGQLAIKWSILVDPVDPTIYIRGLREAIEAVEQGRVILDPLLTNTYPPLKS